MHRFPFGWILNRQDSFSNTRPGPAAPPPYLSGLQANGPNMQINPAGPSWSSAEHGYGGRDGWAQVNFENGMEYGTGLR